MQNAQLTGDDDIDAIEVRGMQDVLKLAARLAASGEAKTENRCDEGARAGAARMKLAGRNNNPCYSQWSTNSLASCDPCSSIDVQCAPRDMPYIDQCSCGYTGPPTTQTSSLSKAPTMQVLTPNPTLSPTKAPAVVTLSPTLIPGSGYWAVCGRRDKCTNEDDHVAPVDDLHEVRCCSDMSKTGWVRRGGCSVWGESKFDGLGGCFSLQSFEEADSICRSEGSRICSKTELQSDCTRGSGCGHDSDLIWSGTTGAGDMENRYAVCGRGVVGNMNECPEGDSKLVPVDYLHKVWCCSDSPISGWSEKCSGVWGESKFGSDGCFKEKTFEEAENICSLYGGRLCTIEELEGSCTKGTGCRYDAEMIWSSEGLRRRRHRRRRSEW